MSGEPLHFERDSSGTFHAVAAVPIGASDPVPGTIRLHRAAESIPFAVPVAIRSWPAERLRTAPEYTAAPDSALSHRLAWERAQVQAAYARAHETPRLWWLWFSPPMRTRVTSAFGTRRILNGDTRSRHYGLDFDGRVGEPVRAANHGEVVLVGDFFYSGNCAYVSHGAGLVTAYLHMSKVHVQPGDTVERGQVIGEVGATGRVTGPHLHWAVHYGRLSVDPNSLLSLRPLPVPAVADSGLAGRSPQP